MPIQLECDSCGRRVKVKEEYAGRRLRCPGCDEPIQVPKARDDFEEDFEEEDYEERPARKSRGQKPAIGKRGSGQKSSADSPWYRRHWHWLAAGVIMLFSLWPKVGLVIAGLFAAVGVVMILIGGIAPFLRVLFGAPGTVLSMIFLRSARFDMMRAPDNHPYKVLVRTAFDPWRGLFWKGVLLVVMFIPAAVVNSNIKDVFKSRAPDPGPNPNLVGPGQRPLGAPPQNDPRANPNVRQEPNPAGGNQEQPGGGPLPGRGFPPQGQSNQSFLYTVTYNEFSGEGSPGDAALAALKINPDFSEDSLNFDEPGKTFQFTYKARIAPQALTKLLESRGFRSLRVQMSSQ